MHADVLVGVLMEPLQVTSLLQVLVQVFVLLLLKVSLLKVSLLKVSEVLSLSSPLTRTQTTMPQTRPGGA